MFAGFGILGNLIDNVKSEYKMELGSSANKFKLYNSLDPLSVVTTDTDATGMFVFNMFGYLDLKNVDVSKRKSLSRMFEFCIMPGSAINSKEATNKGMDIST